MSTLDENLQTITAVSEAWERRPKMRLVEMILEATGEKDLFWITNEELIDGLNSLK